MKANDLGISALSNVSSENISVNLHTKERLGLSSVKAEELYLNWGYNEIPEVEISLWWIFLLQFTGTMPYMLELAAIISIAVLDYVDFAIIVAMLLCNAILGFTEQMKAADSLVRTSCS